VSDRIQTLTVELMREEISALLLPGGFTQEFVEAAKAKLRNALSQPEHQGDELVEDLLAMARDAERSDVLVPAEWAEPLRAAADRLSLQPPAPVLSDEEKEQIGLLLDLVEDPTDDEGELDQQRATKALGREVESTEYAEQVAIEARRVLDSFLRKLATPKEEADHD
jgi:hypothetical protein